MLYLYIIRSIQVTESTRHVLLLETIIWVSMVEFFTVTLKYQGLLYKVAVFTAGSPPEKRSAYKMARFKPRSEKEDDATGTKEKLRKTLAKVILRRERNWSRRWRSRAFGSL